MCRICLVVAFYRIAPQPVDVAVCLQCEAVVLAVVALSKSTAAVTAIPAHGGEIFQNTLPQIVYNSAQFILKFLGVQLLGASRPPGVVESLFSAMSEVDADMADSPHFFILFRRLGIEKPRLIW